MLFCCWTAENELEVSSPAGLHQDQEIGSISRESVAARADGGAPVSPLLLLLLARLGLGGQCGQCGEGGQGGFGSRASKGDKG